MTDAYTAARHSRTGRIARYAYAYMSLFVIILFFKNADVASRWVSEGLALCASRLIPSLFPFMVLSSLVLSSGLGTLLSRLAGAPLSALFGLSRECATPIVLDWLCGFPLGAKCASELYEKDRINHQEYERVLCICGTPSPAFLISAVGGSMLSDKKYGIWLYAISLASAIAVGIFLKLTSPVSHTPHVQPCEIHCRVPLAKCITGAVLDALSGILCVCAFVVFFGAFLGVLDTALCRLSLPESVHSLIYCVFELTAGLSRICKSWSPASLPLSALAVGWAGLSVHFQTMAICASSGKAPKMRTYILSHVARAAICFLLTLGANALIFRC